MERLCFFNPAIDTKFGPGYSEEAFSRITVGMPKTSVRGALGAPLTTFTNINGDEEWLYTDDGKCYWGDFAWLWRSVVFRDDSVISVNGSIRYN